MDTRRRKKEMKSTAQQLHTYKYIHINIMYLYCIYTNFCDIEADREREKQSKTIHFFFKYDLTQMLTYIFSHGTLILCLTYLENVHKPNAI